MSDISRPDSVNSFNIDRYYPSPPNTGRRRSKKRKSLSRLHSDSVEDRAPPYDPAEFRADMSLVDQYYTEGITLNQLPHSVLNDMRRLLRIPAKVTITTMSHYGVVGLNSRDGLIFPRYVFRRGEGSTQQPSGIKIYRLTADTTAYTDEVLPRSRFGGIFGFHLVEEDMKEVVLTANEVDAMSVYQDLKRPALGLPRGGTHDFVSEILPYMEQFERIVIWFPSDKQSWERAKKIAYKMGQSRCYFIRPREKFPTPAEWFHSGKSLGTALEQAEPLVSRTVETFPHLRESVMEDMMQREQKAGVRWRRFPRLNSCIKGLRLGELTIVSGPTGAGKTTFMSEYSLDLCEQGVRTLWASFENSNARLCRGMILQFSRVNLEQAMTPSKFDYWADKFERIPMHFMKFQGPSGVGSMIEELKAAIFAHEVHHVVVDNIQFMLGMQYSSDKDDRYYQQDRIIDNLRQLSSNHNVHVSIVVHPKHENPYEEITIANIFGGVKACQAADNVMVIQQIAMDIPPYVKRYFQVLKNRYDGDLILSDKAIIDFDKRNLTYVIGRLKAVGKLQD